MPEDPCSVHSLANTCLDILVLAGGPGHGLHPMSPSTPKAMVPVCNRPLIWYALKPWADAGCSTFFICTNDMLPMEPFLRNCVDFDGIVFHFFGPAYRSPAARREDTKAVTGDGTCDAIRAFFAYKQTLDRADSRLLRDTLVLSCDTILAGVDVQPFIAEFYKSFSSAAVMYRTPLQAKESDKKTLYKEALHYAGLEESDFDAAPSLDVFGMHPLAQARSPPDVPHPVLKPQHRRLHLSFEEDDRPHTLTLSAGFLARRQHMVFTSLFDAHVYLLRSWVVDFVANSNDEAELRSIQRDLLPRLCESQYWTISGDGTSASNGDRLGYGKPIPRHWALAQQYTDPAEAKGDSSLSMYVMNSMQGLLPKPWDTLRVFAAIYNGDKGEDSPRIMRVNTTEKYKYLTKHILQQMTEGAAASPISKLAGPQIMEETVGVEHQAHVKNSALLSVPPPDTKVEGSVIGRNVTMGAGCRIIDSVVMDSVEIGSNCVIQDSILCPSCQLESGVTLKRCTVAQRTAVKARAYENKDL